MAPRGECSKHKDSVRYWSVPLDVQYYGRKRISHQKYASRTLRRGIAQTETKSTFRGVTPTKLVSAVSGIWDYIGDPAVLQNRKNLKNHDIYQKENIKSKSDKQRKHKLSFVENENFCNGLKSICFSSSTERTNFEELKHIKKQLLFSGWGGNSFICKHVWLNGSLAPEGNDKRTTSVTPTVETRPPYGRKNEKSILEDLKDVPSDSFTVEHEKASEESASQAKGNYVTSGCNGASRDNLANSGEQEDQIPGSLYLTYSFAPWDASAVVGFKGQSYSLNLGYNFDFLSSTDCTCEQCQQAITAISSLDAEVPKELSSFKNHNINESDLTLSQDLRLEEQHSLKYWLRVQDKVQNVLAKNRPAIAGALAGTMVSLCLHPIDTVKTIIQADGMGQNSIFFTLRRIISEKGISGLYRGIAAKIASSAPISAIYTFTYETTKGALLPILPKEYHPFAHCFAGGCSSIATSVVFTPSEHIKQQMQVGVQYQNSWNAIVGCLEKGGLPSLYAGWMAVLCRNVPHSVIKFYTYEKLKQLFAQPDGDLGTLHTLLCGGVAGSTAALFTTPFDVVKTKLQTQAPGTMGKYNGVLHALQEIARREGLHGLYRGLTPRLAMYISQGAIFFASYESLKAVFGLGVPQPNSQYLIPNKKIW